MRPGGRGSTQPPIGPQSIHCSRPARSPEAATGLRVCPPNSLRARGRLKASPRNSASAPPALSLPGRQRRPRGSSQGARRSAPASTASRRNKTEKLPRQSLTQ
ncbi:hypothetical protein NDU88_003372 [Pleurodeles waltl]|uniref:Uncharacterized protein n=1 Tax=Pleurodeles waltl TaxID=8319 RepID=A0AAV7PHZ1_PLEWA|nr:hypothetical protein NDU88_003372 [Pleurodeles waltl]